MRRYQAELVAFILAHASSAGVQLLSRERLRGGEKVALQSLFLVVLHDVGRGAQLLRDAFHFGFVRDRKRYRLERRAALAHDDEGRRSAFALGIFSSFSQKPASFWSAAGYASQIGLGVPGIAEQAGFFSVSGCRHFGPQLRRNTLMLAGLSRGTLSTRAPWLRSAWSRGRRRGWTRRARA